MNLRKHKRSLYAKMPRKGMLWHFSRSPAAWKMKLRKMQKVDRLYRRVGANPPEIVFGRHIPFNDRCTTNSQP